MGQTKNLANIGLADIIGNVIAAGFWFYLAILLIPESYGELHYFISIAGIVSYFTLIGTSNTITVYVAKKIPIQSTFNFISLVGAIIGFIVLFFIFERIDIGFLVLGYVIYNLSLGEILGKKEYKGYLKYILIQKTLTPILGLGFFFGFGVEGVIYGLALSYTAFYFRIIRSFKEIKIDFSLVSKRKGFIINNYLMSITSTFHGQIDKIIILPILGAALLGNYSLSLQVISTMTIISSILFKYMLPQESSGHNVKKTRQIIIISSIGLTFVGFFIIPMIIPTVFPKYIESIDAIRIMSLSLFPISLVKIYMSKFLALEKSRFLLIGFVISLSILIPTMIGFGVWYGISGIASSFVLATIIQASYFYVINRKINQSENIERS